MLGPISDESMSLFSELLELNNQTKSETNDQIKTINIDDEYLGSLIHPSIQSNKTVGDYSTSVVNKVTPLLSFPPFSPASSGSDSGISSDIQDQQVDFDFQDLNGDLDNGFHGIADQLDIDLSDADAHTIQQALDKMVCDQSLQDSNKSTFDDLLMVFKDDQETSLLSAVSSDCDSGDQNPDDLDTDILPSDFDGMQGYKSTEDLTNFFSDVDWLDNILGSLPEEDQNDQSQVDSSCHREDSQVADGYLSNQPSQSMSRNLLPHATETIDLSSVNEMMDLPSQPEVSVKVIVHWAEAGSKGILHDHTDSGLNSGRPNSAVTKKSGQKKEKNSRASGIEVDGESFSRQQITEMEVEDFNALINGQSPEKAQLARDIRRREKNKHAASECRKRKIDKIGSLENEVQLMRDKAKKMKSENNEISKQINAMKKNCAALEDNLGVKTYKLDGEYIVVPRK